MTEVEKTKLASQAGNVIIALMKKYNIPQQYADALLEAYRSGAKDILAKMLEDDRKEKIKK